MKKYAALSATGSNKRATKIVTNGNRQKHVGESVTHHPCMPFVKIYKIVARFNSTIGCTVDNDQSFTAIASQIW